MRPVLKAALRRVWRDGTTLQFGVDPDRAVVLRGLTPEVLGTLELLDGTRREDEVVAEAGEFGLRADQADLLIDLLLSAGLLDDATSEDTAHSIGAFGPDLAALSLRHPAPGSAADVLARRRSLHVKVHGAGRVGAQIARLLAAAGVGGVSVLDPQPVRATDVLPGGHRESDIGTSRQAALSDLPEPSRVAVDLVVVAPVGVADVPLPVAAELLSTGVPHLLVRIRELTGMVGPLVLPGSTPCLTCLHLHRRDRDGAWPILAAQLSGERDDDPADATLCTLVAGLASMQCLAYLDGDSRSPLPATIGGTLEIVLPDWRVRRRTWTSHPDCDCSAALSRAAVGGRGPSALAAASSGGASLRG